MGLLGEIKNILKPSSRTQNPTQAQQTNYKDPSLKTIKHNVAGVTHYKDNILSFAIRNQKYSLSKKEMIAADIESIFEYNFKTEKTELIPEPTNIYDPNAIKVVVDGKHVGYIKKGSCKHILNLLNENRIAKIDSRINGGNCKYFELNGNGDLVFKQGYIEYNIVLSITEKQKENT